MWAIERVLPAAADYRKFATRLVGPDEADDIVQEAYARLVIWSLARGGKRD